MNSQVQGVVSVLGRLLLSLIFLLAAVGNKIPNFSSVAKHMESAGIPAPQFLLVGAIVFLLAGSISVILGYHVRIGAALLLVFLAMASYYFHNFWALEGQERQTQTIHFMKNLAMSGAMLFLIANGPGSMSLDARRQSKLQ